MALFNPALALAKINGELPLKADTMPTLPGRVGVDPKELSPYHQVKSGAPPTIIFHGQGDETVLYMSAEHFTKAMKKAGNQCELVGYAEQPHGFFNYRRSENKYFKATLKELDRFLVSLKYLEGKAAIE
jgi:acetyl esterase/lipase